MTLTKGAGTRADRMPHTASSLHGPDSPCRLLNANQLTIHNKFIRSGRIWGKALANSRICYPLPQFHWHRSCIRSLSGLSPTNSYGIDSHGLIPDVAADARSAALRVLGA